MATSMDSGTGAADQKNPYLSWNKGYAFILACLVGIVLFNIPMGLNYAGRGAVALTMAAIVMWIFEILPVELTAILLSACFVVFGVANPVVAFSGYGSPVVWFIFSALVFGLAVDVSGVGKRLAYNMMRFSGNSLISLTIPIILTGLILSFLTPAGVERIVILYPICAGIVGAFVSGKMSDSNIGKLSVAIVYLAGNTFGFGILTGITVNILGVGIVKNILGTQVYWTQWFIWFALPAFLITVISIILMFKVFPPEKWKIEGGSKEIVSSELAKMGPITATEKRASLYLVITLIFWITGQINHIPPWAVAIFAASLFCAPKIGVLSLQDIKKVPFPIVVFSGAAVTIGAVMNKTGAAAKIGKILLGSFIHQGMSHQVTGLVTYLAGIIAHFPLLESQTAAAGYTPIVAAFFKSMGMYALGPSVLAIFVGDTIAFFPYMIMPALLLLSWISMKDTIKILSIYSAVAIVINVLAMFTWYHWVGLL